jgi:hypothetical protein
MKGNIWRRVVLIEYILYFLLSANLIFFILNRDFGHWLAPQLIGYSFCLSVGLTLGYQLCLTEMKKVVGKRE